MDLRTIVLTALWLLAVAGLAYVLIRWPGGSSE